MSRLDNLCKYHEHSLVSTLLPAISVVKLTQLARSISTDEVLADVEPEDPAGVVELHQAEVLHHSSPVGGVEVPPEREGHNSLVESSLLTSETAAVASRIIGLLIPEFFQNTKYELRGKYFSTQSYLTSYLENKHLDCSPAGDLLDIYLQERL